MDLFLEQEEKREKDNVIVIYIYSKNYLDYLNI